MTFLGGLRGLNRSQPDQGGIVFVDVTYNGKVVSKPRASGSLDGKGGLAAFDLFGGGWFGKRAIKDDHLRACKGR